LPAKKQVLVIEDASLEIVPKELRSHSEIRRFNKRFMISPEYQILDRNFHAEAMKTLGCVSEKSGRPDVVHFALLDATSTPLFRENRLRILIHTIGDQVIEIKEGVRPPRTLQRFCGVMANIRAGSLSEQEFLLFNRKENQSFENVVSALGSKRTVCFTRKGKIGRLDRVVNEEVSDAGEVIWVVGGFPKGSFDPIVTESSEASIAISNLPLPAHVVTARLCYELEKCLKIVT
jgi:rRNA small subunit pseudouridine methyltransferase Nep1